MKDKDTIKKKSQLKEVWKSSLIGVLTAGMMIGAHEFIFDTKFSCSASFSFFAYTALHFAIISIGFAFFFLTASFMPRSMAAVGEIFPDANGNAICHARSIYRLGAVSNIGCALIFFACGWMFPYDVMEVWHLFPAMFGIGLAVVICCQIVLWVRHEPYRDVTLQSYALKAVLFILAMLAILIYWTYQPFYFDPVAVILLYIVCSVVAGLLVGIRHQIAFHRSRK